ncbi:hypothetical protein BTUL_0083g00060 [Botrytis tulipae]|uniref:Ubiquitin 3 binding protein But2 C-terminal domain-containing protein n=1 Tax=Botrytis tulipae TaxID=87230 RepID=A0A4Z1EQN9_9HELO|nr:hypothetical protein BTUL_0083g00060 [Botrytis tulipae]
MFVPVSKIKFLTILLILFVIVSGNPIKRSEDEATGVRISGIFGLFTTIATSALTTGQQVGIVIISSQTVYIQEPNYFPATEWGVPEPTRSSSSSSTFAAGAIAVTSTFGNTPYSFATSGFPAASTQVDASASGDSLTDAPASASASSSEDPVTETPASASASDSASEDPSTETRVSAFASASSSEDPSTETQASASVSVSTESIPTLILTPINEDKQQVAATTASCNPAVAGVTIPASALTTGEYIAVEVLCEETIYIQEPNFYPTKTWYGMPTSWTLDTTEKISTSTSTSSICNTTVAGTTIPASALTTGEFVAVETLCGETIYIQEPNFYPTKTYYGVSDAALGSMTKTSAMSASSSSTTMDVGWQILNARAEDGVLIFRE